MMKWPMDAFCSAPLCVEVLLRRKLSPPFSEMRQHKELMRGSRSCGPLMGRRRGPIAAFWQDGCVVWSGHGIWGVRRGGRGVFSLFHPCHIDRAWRKAPFTFTCVWLDVHAWLIEGVQWHRWIDSGRAGGRLRVPPVLHGDRPWWERQLQQTLVVPDWSQLAFVPHSHKWI